MTIRNVIAGREMHIAFPRHLAESMLPLLVSEVAEFEAVFGAPVLFVDDVPPSGPRWILTENGDAHVNSLRWDADNATLISTVRDAAGLGATLQMLHSLVTLDVDVINDARADDLPAAVSRISIEIERGFPGFEIRGLDWSDMRADLTNNCTLSLDDVQCMIAHLQDGHTAVRRNVSVYNPPYAVALVDGVARILRVPAWSAAAQAGVQAGWTLNLDDIDGWLARTGSPPHSHALVAGRRAVALNGISEREFTAINQQGESQTWTEQAVPPSLDQLLQTEVVANHIVYVRLHNWIEGVGIPAAIDRILAEHAHRHTLVLDLRGNTGGNLVMVQLLRRRFLRQRTLLGTIRFTRADGTLSDHQELWEDPAEQGTWHGDLVVLTDPLTYSASEDFLHGLQGLPHVTIIGAPSGGGSGRPRTLPLIPGWSVTISTALTFDRNGHCIEGQGIPVDIVTDPFTEQWRGHLGLPTT